MLPDSNLFSYLKWRGDISFAQASFNEVDALILSIFSYLNLPQIVSSKDQPITLVNAAAKYFAPGYSRSDYPFYQRLFALMAHANRFKKAKLSHFVSKLTPESQFSAIEIQLENGLHFLAFRGTDDSLVGWKEDFEISFQTTKAQRQARNYLSSILQGQKESYYIGGHSKGGNLAEYAALNLAPALQQQIKRIYTFDSPGIAKEVGSPLSLKYLQKHLKRYVPEFSIVGRLFEPAQIQPVIIASSAAGLAQHDAFSWEITGSHFVTRRHRSPQARIYNQIINNWIGNATLSERKSLTNDLFAALAASGATKITELNKYGFSSFGAILFSLTGASRRTRYVFGSLFSAIWQSIKNRQLTKRLFNVDSVIGWVMLLLGIITLTAPQYALRAFAALIALAGIGYSTSQMLKIADSHLKKQQKRFFIISWLIVFAVSTALISNNRLLIFLAHYFLGLFLIIFSYVRLRQVILHRTNGIFHKIINVLEALAAFALGITVIINPQSLTMRSIIVAGILLIIYGFCKLIWEIFGQRGRLPHKHR